jgi:hypothetical protein
VTVEFPFTTHDPEGQREPDRSAARRLALIGYAPDYFDSFGAALEAACFDVYWVHGMHSAAMIQARAGSVPPSRFLDTTAGFDPSRHDRAPDTLSALEYGGGPRIYDVILMDRVLRHKPYEFAVAYLAHVAQRLSDFLTSNGIALVSSGRDTALQLMSMLVCRRLGIPWVVPTRMRIPQDRYMFAAGHETGSILDLAAPDADDRAWAERFLHEFRESRHRAALKASVSHFSEVLRMLPRHARLFWGLVRRARWDRGNDYARYTIPAIMRMYLRRRVNLVLYKMLRPYRTPADKPFCLYALHTQPESSIDVGGSWFSDQLALVTFIVRALPVSHELYVKIHPTDIDGKPLAFYRALAKIPGVRVIAADVDSRQLVQRASLILTLTGTIGYEAALLGKPVIAFANNYFNGLPTVRYCGSPPDLAPLIDAQRDAVPPEDLDARIVTFLAYLKAQSFGGEVNRMYLPSADALDSADLAHLQKAYERLYASLVGRRSSPKALHAVSAQF